MLIPMIAYDTDQNLGRAYNRCMERLKDDDWACFLDHDVMFTTPDWYSQIEHIVALYPDGGLFTAVTARIGHRPQKVAYDLEDCHDITRHMEFSRRQQGLLYDIVWDDTPNEGGRISGIVMVTSKKVWRECGGFKDGFFGVDNMYHIAVRTAGYKVYIMQGVYVYHWYRGDAFSRDYSQQLIRTTKRVRGKELGECR